MNRPRIYTRTGDAATSQLFTVGRVSKHHDRLEAYGTVDELNSLIGLALAGGVASPLDEQLTGIQQQLFVLGSELAVPHPEQAGMSIPRIEPRHVRQIEDWIDALDAALPPLRNFILPGGDVVAAQLHCARTVCRRAERCISRLHGETPLADAVLAYINRLADYLFVAARQQNAARGVAESVWISGE
ncbi:MAG: ATP:cob(I)alamin adenosyltransferase [Salinisphaeraceae bacterium]|nr:ATP:cob(I)alamin adenosyltransferase [Salinisphaeraceae bacterium]